MCNKQLWLSTMIIVIAVMIFSYLINNGFKYSVGNIVCVVGTCLIIALFFMYTEEKEKKHTNKNQFISKQQDHQYNPGKETKKRHLNGKNKEIKNEYNLLISRKKKVENEVIRKNSINDEEENASSREL